MKTLSIICATFLVTFGLTDGAQIYLRVSALANISPDGTINQRHLEMYWDVEDLQSTDQVAIYDNTSNPIYQVQPTTPRGYHTSNITFPHVTLHGFMDDGVCLGYWSAYLRDDEILSTDCIKVRPNWQSKHKDVFSNASFSTLIIPGVHDSGTYTNYSIEADNALFKYAITQDESIYNVLIYGNRDIDLRAGYFVGDSEEHYWVVHGVTVWRPFRDVLREAKKFVEEYDEIIILEVSGFQYFNSTEHHLGLINLIEEELGDRLIPNSYNYNTPFSTFWEDKKNIVVIYGADEYTNMDHLWNTVPNRWSNTQSIEALEEYMIKVLEEDDPLPPPWMLSGQLTPLAADVILDTLGGLRQMADSVNRNVTDWFRYRWLDKLSIISCDFVLSAGYVDLAVEANLERHTK